MDTVYGESAVLYQLCCLSSEPSEEKRHNWYSTALFFHKTATPGGHGVQLPVAASASTYAAAVASLGSLAFVSRAANS